MERISVLVTGASGGGVGEQIIKALKLSSLNLEIITTNVNKNSKGLLDGDIGYIVPYASDDKYISTILELCSKHNIQVLFPGSEAELTVIGKNREVFEEKGILLPINSERVINICTDKTKTMTFLKENGFTFPKNITVRNTEDIKKIDFLPAVIKPSIGGGGSKDIMIAQTKGEVELFSTYLLNIYEEFIVQEYIGTPDSEYTVGILNTMDGEFINSIAVHKSIETALNNRIKIKNRTGIETLGKNLVVSSGISEGYVDRFPEVTNVCEKIVEKLGAKAAINVQCRLYQNQVFVFEINPRFSGTTSIRALMGYNEPEVLIRRHILGEKIEQNFKYQSGYVARGLQEVLVENKE
ncbi:ATP-grasp domain-containing protein [Aliarcobacter butzleri]|uniref:ATP-grasp domain-containing protein n=1 Tax=Aliarcobacter butzleri TaxID=28197 RepID=UPI00263CCDAE|nr:ATP-grasp domain-containing protein [Aliarcobacter butzleri]MDN5096028.1 ATP-grasp domain-containing protein [Aliarcobacter butzleri]